MEEDRRETHGIGKLKYTDVTEYKKQENNIVT
jgi:hypothetical protein